jgi:hypothetical protein
MQVTKEEAKDIVYDDHEDWSLVEKAVVGTIRWSTQYLGYFRHNPTNTTYMLDWQEGSTESQDERPFDYTEPELVEVVQIPKTIMVWVPVENEQKISTITGQTPSKVV